jgi:hypothetical protein
MATEATKTDRKHSFHAEAHALRGELTLPLVNRILPQAFVKLSEDGGYLSERSTGYRLESILKYEHAYTQVSGHREVKEGHGWNTLTTSVVEGLNVLEVVTADRVVSQIATEFPLEGYTPHISFLGTRFDNLRICGHKIEPDLDLNLFGEKPEDDAPYTRSPGFIDRVCGQHARIREGHDGLVGRFAAAVERYNRVPESFASNSGDEDVAECSLVNKITHQAEHRFPGRHAGHVIHIPHFGTIYLATLKITHSDPKPETRIYRKTLVELTMIDIQMGCATTGSTSVGTARTNGTSKP